MKKITDDDEKVLRNLPMFRKIAGRFVLKHLNLTSQDLVHEALIAYFKAGMPPKVSRRWVRCRMIDACKKARRQADLPLPGTAVSFPDKSLETADYLWDNPRLTPDHRKLLRQYYFDGLTYREIGKKEGVSRTTICNRLHRSLLRLKEILTK